jgi:hypothetical protein
MRRAILASALLVACVGDSPTITKDGGSDGGGADVAPDVVQLAPPKHAASSFVFHDSDIAQGTVNGTVVIGKAADESDVDSYVLYWGANATTKLNGQSAIATLPKSGADVTYVLTGPVPLGATKLLVFTSNSVGEMATGLATDDDNYPKYVDISASSSTGWNHIASVVDDIGGKLLTVTTQQNSAPTAGPMLFQCNLDGSGCVAKDISAGTLGALSVHLAIDRASSKLVTVSSAPNETDGPRIHRCNLDGTSCTYASLSSVQQGGINGVPLIDTVNNKLLVVAESFSLSSHLGVYRCNLDATACVFTDASALAGKGASSGQMPSPVIDKTNQKLLVATEDGTNSDRPTLFVCSLDMTACTAQDISVSQGANSGYNPSAVLDTAANKIVVATDFANGFRCNLDGTSCAYHSISAGGGNHPSALIEPSVNALFTAVEAASQKLGVIRCAPDATTCVSLDASAGRPISSGLVPSMSIDHASQRLLVTTVDGSNGNKPALYTLGLF